MDNRCGTVVPRIILPRTRGKHGRNLRHFRLGRGSFPYSLNPTKRCLRNVLSYTPAFIVGHDNLPLT
jgi:hypothetical protein